MEPFLKRNVNSLGRRTNYTLNPKAEGRRNSDGGLVELLRQSEEIFLSRIGSSIIMPWYGRKDEMVVGLWWRRGGQAKK